ncbi:12986_t:CDS:2, partial [Gigaspora margarita]
EEMYHNGQLNDEKLTNQTENYVMAIKLRNRRPKMTPTMKKCTITEDSNDEYPRRKAEKV